MPLIGRILVPTDFSACARRALDYGAELASQLSAPLVLLHVHAPPKVYAPDEILWVTIPDEPELRAELERTLGALADEARQLGARDVSIAVVDGDPWHAIVEVARDRDCDLIVIGTHGRGALKQLLLGAVADKVVRRAHCPVLTVKEEPG
jgi:nucleotide-binding universal stress UspA family protein